MGWGAWPWEGTALGAAVTSHMPHTKKPKARAPRGMRDMILFPGRALPTYTGPYAIGTMEIEVPVDHPRHFSRIARQHHHLLQLETVLMTIYYPASLDTPELAKKKKRRPSRQLWLGRPRLMIAGGYGRFAGFPEWVGWPLFLLTMFTKLPAYRNAHIAEHWAAPKSTKQEGKKVKLEGGEKPEGAEDMPTFPLIMFSHGLGGTATMYSSVCGEFASYGFVVCAVEHRDGSGPRTYVNHPASGPASIHRDDIEKEIDHSEKERNRGYDIIDYIFPKDNPGDTAPNNEKGVDHELRNAQTNLRSAEVEEAYKVMCTIVAGEGEKVAEKNLRCKGFKASSSHGLNDVDWAAWKNRVRLDHVTACGHSFGSATITNMLRKRDSWQWFSQGIIYDTWGAGVVPPEEEHPEHRIQAPLLAINSEAFTYWPSNHELVQSLVDEAQAEPHPAPSWSLTVRGTVHVSQSDFSLLYPKVCSFFLKMVANPRRALDLNINASLEFLSQVLPPDMAHVLRAYENEGLLESDLTPLERVSTLDLHRPKEKFVAARLQIKDEWLYRLTPTLYRRWKRRIARKSGKEYSTDSEVWVLSKPDTDVVASYLASKSGDEKEAREKVDGALPLTAEHSEKKRDPDLEAAMSGGGGDSTVRLANESEPQSAKKKEEVKEKAKD